MDAGSFGEYLSRLDEEALTRILRVRADVRVEPVPRGFGQLAQRLGGAESLGAGLRGLNRDLITVGRAVAALGAEATVAEVARMLGADDEVVRGCVAELCDRGMAWTDKDLVCLPERLGGHWSAEIGGGRPVEKIGRTVYAEDLKAAVTALGMDATGLRKPELIARLAERMSDVPRMVAVIKRLPPPARTRLDELRRGSFGIYYGYDWRGTSGPDAVLLKTGLVLTANGRAELPREVAVAAWLGERELMLTGRPEVVAAERTAAQVRTAARAAVEEALRGVTALLDDTRSAPATALKKGGIGPRERRRLAGRLSIAEDVLVLWIDLAHAAGLLGQTEAGYAPTGAYGQWREAAPSRQWAALASAWFALEHAPTRREIDDDREQPPPLPLMSAAGGMRRALLLAARSGLSVAGTAREIDWFFPLHGYDPVNAAEKMAATIREAELLGVVAADRLTELGKHMLAAADPALADEQAAGAAADRADGAAPGATDEQATDEVSRLARRCAPLLPEAACTVILQSDLTAVVAGRPSVQVARLLAAAAVSEARGSAAVWRFTPASVRAALDAGWRADDLLAELKAASDSALPQPLEYLITDVARRHGHVKVRGMRSCILADEATITEIVHTRSLARLHLSKLAPTVASSPFELDEVLTRLRAAGLSPVAEDATGAVIVEGRQEHQADGGTPVAARPQRRVLGAAELARKLAADPHGRQSSAAAGSHTVDLLAQLNPGLDDAERELLADAIDHQRDVLIAYRDKNGSRTVRQVTPHQVYGRWLDAWCHLRNGQRDFTVANIEFVAPG